MFPYPSGAGLHVGHPLGYIGTDVYARFKRMTGHNVLHAMGYDAFGLPAEQYALQTGQHPRVTTDQNIATMRRQLRRARARARSPPGRRRPPTSSTTAGRSGSSCRSSTPGTTRTQDKARPIDELDRRVRGRHARAAPDGRPWAELDELDAQERVVDSYRLAYLEEVAVNWCPALGTVLANEEVTAEGRSERGNHPVYKRPLKQWMLRITEVRGAAPRRPRPARLARVDQDHAAQLDRSQRGRRHRLPGRGPRRPRHPRVHDPPRHRVRRHLHGAGARARPRRRDRRQRVARRRRRWSWRGTFGTRRVARPEAVDGLPQLRRRPRPISSARPKGGEKTGIFIGAFAINPVNGERIPIFIADYVLAGLRHRRDHGGARSGPSATGTSPRSSTFRSSAPCSRRPTSTARRTWATGPRSTAASSTA